MILMMGVVWWGTQKMKGILAGTAVVADVGVLCLLHRLRQVVPELAASSVRVPDAAVRVDASAARVPGAAVRVAASVRAVRDVDVGVVGAPRTLPWWRGQMGEGYPPQTVRPIPIGKSAAVGTVQRG